MIKSSTLFTKSALLTSCLNTVSVWHCVAHFRDSVPSFFSINSSSAALPLLHCTETSGVFATARTQYHSRAPAMSPTNKKFKAPTASAEGAVRAAGVMEVLPTPTKSLSDQKDYRSLMLTNRLRVLLVCDSKRHGPPSQPAETKEGDSRGASEGSDEEGEEEEEEEEEDEEGCSSEEDDETEGEDRGGGSEKTEYKAAASLAVSWGSCEDPPELPGLMHFLEHMVFMGSEKYPAENSFDEFITRHGGGDNAYTDCEHTNFHFDVHESYLWEALDRFSQFFVAPLMKSNAMERERNAVDSEFTMALTSDCNREQQLLSSLAPPDHPCSLFTWGNKDSLSQLPDDLVHQKLHQYREKFYSAQYMTLVVQSRHSLDDMEEQVAAIFSLVPNNGLPKPDYSQLPPPFPPAAVNKVLKVEPMKAKHLVTVTWFLPPMLHRYRTQPLRLLSQLIGHEGPGSLLSYYKQRNWSCGLSSESEEGDFEDGSFCSQLRVLIDLTEEGYRSVDQVLLALFQYTSLLRKTPPTQEMFLEFQKIAQLNFDYESESEPMTNVQELSASMIDYPSEDYITGSSIMFEFDPQFMAELSERLTPDTANIILRSQLLGDLSKLPNVKTEKWFGTNYTIEDISPEWRSLFSSAETTTNPALHLPRPNLFIPTDFTLLPCPASPPPIPVALLKDPVLGSLYHKPDHKFQLPMVQVQLQFVLQELPDRRKEIFQSQMATLLSCYRYQLMEPAYDALLAKAEYFISYSLDGLLLTVTCFSETVQRFIDLLLDHLKNFSQNLKQDHFDTLKDLEIRSQYNYASKPSNIRNQLRLHLLLPESLLALDHLQLLKGVTMNSVRQCSEGLLRNAQVNMLMQGNISAAAAKALYDRVQTYVQRDQGGQPCQYLEQRGYRVLEEGVTVIRTGTTNLADGNSAIVNYYQGDPGKLRSQVQLDFLSCAMEEKCFDTLRTQEQLAYSVYAQTNESNGVLGLSIYVLPQAEKFSVHHVDGRIEAFLNTFGSYLRDLTEEQFSTLRETVINMKKVNDYSLGEEVSRNWTEILRREWLFDRLNTQIELASSISKEEVVQQFEELVNGTSAGFRKLSVQVVGCAEHKKHKPPPLEQLMDKGFSCLEFQCRPEGEACTPATCPPHAVRFVQDVRSYVTTLKKMPHHPIVEL